MEMEVALDQLDAFAETFWAYVQEAKVFAFHGAMGAGKTTTIAALCRYKGAQDVIASPTFSIINEYVYKKEGAEQKLFHIDLYRLNDAEEIVQAGVEDCLFSGKICFVEWAGKAPYLFDDGTVHVQIKPLNATMRKLCIETGSQFNSNCMAEQL